MNSPDQQPTISERIDTVWSMAEQGLFEGHEMDALTELAKLSAKIAAFRGGIGSVAVAHTPIEEQTLSDQHPSPIEDDSTDVPETMDAEELPGIVTTLEPPIISHPQFQPGPHSKWGQSGRSLSAIRKAADDAPYVPKNYRGGRVEPKQQDTQNS